MRPRWFAPLLFSFALVAAACGSTSSSPSGPTATAQPTATPKPLVLPRPSDVPTDGACETEQDSRLGLLRPGVTYHTSIFEPAITFRVPSSDFENIYDGPGIFNLLDITHQGDRIAFWRRPQAMEKGLPVAGVGDSVEDLAAWLVDNPALDVSPPQDVTLGGLHGVVMEVSIAADAENQDSRCPVQVCVDIFSGSDGAAHPPWHWDWGFAGPESARIYLLRADDGVIAVFIDAFDRTTYDSLIRAGDKLFKTLKFG